VTGGDAEKRGGPKNLRELSHLWGEGKGRRGRRVPVARRKPTLQSALHVIPKGLDPKMAFLGKSILPHSKSRLRWGKNISNQRVGRGEKC